MSIAVSSAGRQPADPKVIYRSYERECERHGKRGAYRRVGDRFGISDERVRQLVKKFDTPESNVTPARESYISDDTAYVPPPGALPTPVPSDEAVLCRLLMADAKPDAKPEPPTVMSPPVQLPNGIWQTFGIAELLAQLPPLLETRQDVMKALILFGEVTEPPAFDLALGRHTAALSTAAMVLYGVRWPGWAFALLPVVLLAIWLALPR